MFFLVFFAILRFYIKFTRSVTLVFHPSIPISKAAHTRTEASIREADTALQEIIARHAPPPSAPSAPAAAGAKRSPPKWTRRDCVQAHTLAESRVLNWLHLSRNALPIRMPLAWASNSLRVTELLVERLENALHASCAVCTEPVSSLLFEHSPCSEVLSLFHHNSIKWIERNKFIVKCNYRKYMWIIYVDNMNSVIYCKIIYILLYITIENINTARSPPRV